MRREELVAGGDLAADGASVAVRHIHELHGGISGRVFSLLHRAGVPAAPVRVIHDGVAGAAYGAVRAGLSGAVRAGARAGAMVRADDRPSVESSRRGRLVVGALNGAFGDSLEARGNPLAWPMAIVAAGSRIPVERIGSQFADAGPRVAVFLHGLCETEDAWSLHAERTTPYGERLAAELGYTPVYVRYNSGRHISANGRALVGLLDGLVAAWPVTIAELALVGHSMGGLIARSACHYGAGGEGISRVRHVVALGAPHHGAQLERVAHAAGAALHRLPETRPLADALGSRSVGIRDLYHGYLVDEDWAAFDPDAFLVARAREIPFLDSASHYFAAATLGRDPHALVSRAFGDLLVSRPSAWGQRRGEHLRFPLEHYRSYGAATHFDLLNHPAIGDQLVRWLGAGAPALPVAAA